MRSKTILRERRKSIDITTEKRKKRVEWQRKGQWSRRGRTETGGCRRKVR